MTSNTLPYDSIVSMSVWNQKCS